MTVTNGNDDFEWRMSAYHEAGHAIAYFILGYPPHQVSMGDHSGNVSAGGNTVGADYSSILAPRALRPWKEAFLICVMAGRVGHRFVATPDRTDEDIRCSVDLELGRRCARELCSEIREESQRSKRVEQLLSAALQDAQILLHTPEAKKAVEGLAQALLLKRILNRRQMVDVIKHASPDLNFEEENVTGFGGDTGDAQFSNPYFERYWQPCP